MSHRSATQGASRGFSLFEVVIAAALLGLIGSIVVSTFAVTTRSTNQTTTAANTLAAVDSDISGIKRLAEILTCCPGSCTTNASTIETGVTEGYCDPSSTTWAAQSVYYFPKVKEPATPREDTTAVEAFTNACNAATTAADTITSTLIAAINLRDLPSGIERRTAVVDGPIAAHRVLITYTGTTDAAGSYVNRSIKIVPTVATFCP